MTRRRMWALVFGAWLLVTASRTSWAEERATPSPERGYQLLTTKPYQYQETTPEEFADLWRVWPPELRKEAEQAETAARRRMALSRYGMVEAPGREGSGPPLGYVDDGHGNWSLNCLACHGGKVAGRVIPGLGNSLFAFQTLTQDISNYRVKRDGKVSAEIMSRVYTPLGRSNGTTNAQIFSVALASLRDADLNLLDPAPKPAEMLHHDLDAPPFWNTHRKQRLYIDGFMKKTHRGIMQFVMTPDNSGERIRGWEDDFRDILAWIEAQPAPSWPHDVDAALAERGRTAFESVCARCHGTYGPNGSYPEKTVELSEIGTDGLRLIGIPVAHRQFFETSWFGHYGEDKVIAEPEGYVAPPLNGIWASAPYLHNGSVPTLWHVLHSAERPVVWQRTEDGYDVQRVGLEVSALAELPKLARKGEFKRAYFDTRIAGKSGQGHLFPEELSEDERRAVLEYLKTL